LHVQGNSTGTAKPKPSPAKKEAAAPKDVLQLRDGRFIDYRWVEGRWVLSEFANPKTGEMDWPAWDSVRFVDPQARGRPICAVFERRRVALACSASFCQT